MGALLEDVRLMLVHIDPEVRMHNGFQGPEGTSRRAGLLNGVLEGWVSWWRRRGVERETGGGGDTWRMDG